MVDKVLFHFFVIIFAIMLRPLRRSILLLSCVGLSLGLSLPQGLPTQAETPPASTYQEGFWQPVARVNPKQAIGIQIVNQSGYLLEYGLTEDRGFTQIRPNETGRVYTEPLPMYLAIYPVRASRAILKFNVSVVSGNQIIITVRKSSRGTENNSSVDIDVTGAIYVS